jgi:hypothetical protein
VRADLAIHTQIQQRRIIRLRGLKENQGFEEPASAGFVFVVATLVAKATQMWTFQTSS